MGEGSALPACARAHAHHSANSLYGDAQSHCALCITGTAAVTEVDVDVVGRRDVDRTEDVAY